MSDMYLYLKSTDCLDVFPENVNNHFFVKLSEIFCFKAGINKTALCNINIPSVKEVDRPYEILILTNFVVESYVGNVKLPLIQRCILQYDNGHSYTYFDNALFDVKDVHTDVIEISLLDAATMQYVDLNPGVVYCTFHVTQV